MRISQAIQISVPNRECVAKLNSIHLRTSLSLPFPFFSVSRAKEIAMAVLPVVAVAGLAIGIGFLLYRRFKK
jgi:hypothetical protein